MGRDPRLLQGLDKKVRFQSTRPAWGATKERLDVIWHIAVSIHAPRVGRDRNSRRISAAMCRFNPRAPRGARQGDIVYPGIVVPFQSTRPAWGATPSCRGSGTARWVSIHAPRVGRDFVFLDTLRRNQVSIHAPRVGRDAAVRQAEQSGDVSIHAPRVGRDVITYTVGT